MRNLFITKVRYRIICEDSSTYGADISLTRGLNIIYGPNSVGKSSILLGIIYCLGMEKSLGIFQGKQNPFKPEFYDKIEGKKIIKSQAYIEIDNGKKKITISRLIVGKTDTCTIKECPLDTFETTKGSEYIADGSGVMSENGLQTYLFKFLEWNLVEVPKYEGDSCKLYLENLAPLFFIEQRAGWSQIQARQITRYGIKDIKKIAFEYLMGLDKFDVHLIELRQKELREKITFLESDLSQRENNILVLGNATKDDDNLYTENSARGKILVSKLIELLDKDIKNRSSKIHDLKGKEEEADKFEFQSKDLLREIANKRRVGSDKINSLTREISSYNNYIKNIEITRLKNNQLKKIDKLFSEINVSRCPVCETLLQNQDNGVCTLCKEDMSRISTPEENIAFLEDEKASFTLILHKKELELKKAKFNFNELKEQERALTEKLNHQLQTYYGSDLQRIREIQTETDAIVDELQKLKTTRNRWEELKDIRKQIEMYLSEEKEIKESLKKYSQSVTDTKILDAVLSNFSNNVVKLHLFKDKPELSKELRLDKIENYSPYLESYDLYNISSSSDNIRIIIGYYLALLQTSITVSSEKIKFPNLLLFDEPKQQNLDEHDFEEFIKLTKELDPNSFQIILTTFQSTNKEEIKQFFVYEMKNNKDYLLKRLD